MAQASKRTRQIRRLKRERSMLLKIAEHALNQRDGARIVANAAVKEIDKLNKQLNPETPETSITVIPDEPIENENSNA
jgi:hypothetical protein